MNYYDDPSLSQSKLKELKKSPKHFWAKYIDPDREPDIVTDEMKFGKALHHYLLESNSFADNFIIMPKVDKRTKEGKAIYAEALEKSEQENKQLIDEFDMLTIKKMVANFYSKKMSKILGCKGLFEHELFWNDEGINCKAKPDFFIEPNNIFINGLIVDVKTTQDATPDVFAKSIDKYGYYNQAGFYCKAIKEIYKTQGYPQFIIIAMEKTSPFEISFFEIDELSIELGIQENYKLMQLYKKCVTDKVWAGYADELHTISLPSWAINRLSNN